MINLKKEKFGGLIFNSDNAHELWLDHELFNNVKIALEKKDISLNKKVSNVFKQLDIKEIKDYQILNNSERKNKNDYPFTVLNSPNLIDINITTNCNLHCPHCYINSEHNCGYEMPIDDFRYVIKECKKAGVFQVALGGGEPTTHSQFGTILKELRENNIVPNLTTNGKDLSIKTVYYLARYAGAVALSLEFINEKFQERRGFAFKDFIKSVKKLKTAGVKVVFQITLSKKNLPYIKNILNEIIKYKPYGILFLAYKPQGRGKGYDETLASLPKFEVTKTLDDIFETLKDKTKIGFDCCLTPSLINNQDNEAFTGCSASRTSMAIMSDLSVLPCSFINEKIGNLREHSLSELWQGEIFNNFRNKINNQMNNDLCTDCHSKKICLGGCPIFKLAKCYKDIDKKP